MGNGPDAIATLLDTGTRGVAPATVTVAPAGTVTLIPPGPTTGCQKKSTRKLMIWVLHEGLENADNLLVLALNSSFYYMNGNGALLLQPPWTGSQSITQVAPWSRH